MIYSRESVFDELSPFQWMVKIMATSLKKNSVALARKQTTPTERPPLVGEVSANFCG
jgi:hypothetical protein